jgi:hypothetical protein
LILRSTTPAESNGAVKQKRLYHRILPNTPPDRTYNINQACKNMGLINKNTLFSSYGFWGRIRFQILSTNFSFPIIRHMHKKSYIARDSKEIVAMILVMNCILISPRKIMLDFQKSIAFA